MTDISHYKNYRFDEKKKILFRVITDNKHLLWRPDMKGCAAFNAEVYEKYRDKAEWIGWRVEIDGKVFRYKMPVWGEAGFDEWKETLNDREKQYVVSPLASWECEEIK